MVTLSHLKPCARAASGLSPLSRFGKLALLFRSSPTRKSGEIHADFFCRAYPQGSNRKLGGGGIRGREIVARGGQGRPGERRRPEPHAQSFTLYGKIGAISGNRRACRSFRLPHPAGGVGQGRGAGWQGAERDRRPDRGTAGKRGREGGHLRDRCSQGDESEKW